MRQVGIIYKESSPEGVSFAEGIKREIETLGGKVKFIKSSGRDRLSISRTDIEDPKKIDLLIVLGGDGTLLGVARIIGPFEIPVLGVNLGGLGFITEIAPEEVSKALWFIFKKNRFEIETRMLLCGEIWRNEELVSRNDVLNDIVITKGAMARMIELYVSVDNSYLNTFRADGLIIATATGSTAYNLSAGGPIIYPTLNSFIITPICPFTVSNRPIIIPHTSNVKVRLSSASEKVILSYDGQLGHDITGDDQIIIYKAPHNFYLVKSPFRDYFEILRTKLKWG